MRVIVLAKPVPTGSTDEAFEADLTLDRSLATPVINPNDEYALEAALRLAEGGEDVDVVMLSMAPEEAWAGLSKGLAVGAASAFMVTDDALSGACIVGTANVLAAALREVGFDLVVAGTDTPDGRAGVVCAAVAVHLGIPFISHAASVELHDGSVVARRTRDDGHETLTASLPAFVSVTQQVGELRYPNLRGIMAARTRRPTTWTLADLKLATGVADATTTVVSVEPAASREPTRILKGDPDTVAREVASFLFTRRLIS